MWVLLLLFTLLYIEQTIAWPPYGFALLCYGPVWFLSNDTSEIYVMKKFFKDNPFLVFYIVGSFLSAMSLLAQGQLVAAIWIIILVILLCLYLNHIKDKK